MSSDAERPDPRDERVSVNTSVAVRGDSGFFFGTLRWIEPKRVLVEIDAELADREAVDVRITLSPSSTTALFRGAIGRTLVTARREPARYIIEILDFVAEDKEKFAGWLKNVRTRGTFSNFENVVSAQPDERSRSGAEVRQALERLARRPISSSAADPFGVRSDIVTNGESGAGRTAVRDALRGALTRNRGAAPPPVSAPPPPSGPGRIVASAPTASPPPRAPDVPGTVRIGGGGTNTVGPMAPSTPGVSPASHSPAAGAPRTVRIGSSDTPSGASHAPASPREAALAPPPVRDPTYATTSTRSATWMEVRWHDPEGFARDTRLQLLNGILVVSKAFDRLPDREPLRVVLRHDAFVVECDGAVKAVGSAATTYRLTFDALQFDRLQGWLDDYGKK